MATLSYAPTASGPSAGGIGWINFDTGFSLAPGATITGLSVTLLDGSIMTFNITNTAIVNGGFTFNSQTIPLFAGAPFGTNLYAGLAGFVGLQNTVNPVVLTTSRITISNISIIDPNGNAVPNYTILIADAETTSLGTPSESQVYVTNGAAWSLFATAGSTTNPTVSGLGTTTATITGSGSPTGSPILATQTPSTVTTDISSASGKEGIAIGVAISKVQIDKNIAGRYSATDQFNLTILGTPNNTATTTGSSLGLQPISAYVYGLPSNTYSINESMSAGSIGSIANYTTSVAWTNLTPGGTVGPSPGALGNNVTLALGDILIATITNTPKVAPPGRGINFI